MPFIYEVTLVANFSLITDATPVNYDGGNSVPGESYDVWLDGELVADDVPFRSNSVGNHINDSDHFAVRGSGNKGTYGTLFVDDIVLRDNITIPEPSSFLLCALASLWGLVFRKRRT